MKKIRDSKLEAPANFSDWANRWSLESITCIFLNQRLGLLNESNNDPKAKKLIKVLKLSVIDPFLEIQHINSISFSRFLHS